MLVKLAAVATLFFVVILAAAADAAPGEGEYEYWARANTARCPSNGTCLEQPEKVIVKEPVLCPGPSAECQQQQKECRHPDCRPEEKVIVRERPCPGSPDVSGCTLEPMEEEVMTTTPCPGDPNENCAQTTTDAAPTSTTAAASTSTACPGDMENCHSCDICSMRHSDAVLTQNSNILIFSAACVLEADTRQMGLDSALIVPTSERFPGLPTPIDAALDFYGVSYVWSHGHVYELSSSGEVRDTGPAEEHPIFHLAPSNPDAAYLVREDQARVVKDQTLYRIMQIYGRWQVRANNNNLFDVACD